MRHSESTVFTRVQYWTLLALTVVLLTAIWVQFPRITNPYAIEEDARSFFWWQRLEHPDRFIDDPLEQDLIEQVDIGPVSLIVYDQSPGYSLLFQIASIFINPILFSKLLVFPLLLIAVYYLFQIGVMIRGPGTAFALCVAYVVFNLSSATAISAAGGLQRSFALPLLLGVIYYLIIKRYRAAAVAIFFSGIIYGPAMVLGGAVYALSLVDPRAQSWRSVVNWKQLAPLIIAGLLASLILMPAFVDQLDRGANADASLVEDATETRSLLTHPRFQEGGRRQLFDLYPLIGRGGIATDGSTVLHVLFLAVIVLLTWHIRPQSLTNFPNTLKLFFFAGLLCFTAAWLAALLLDSFPLYLPSRYTQLSMPIFLLIYVMVNAQETLVGIAVWLRRQRGHIFMLTVPMSLVVALIALFGPGPEDHASDAFIFQHSRTVLLLLSVSLLLLSVAAFRNRPPADTNANVSATSHAQPTRRGWIVLGVIFLIPALFYMKALHPGFYVATPEERQLFQFVETLPEDVMIGGSPCSISAIPIFAGRSILFSCEDPHPDEALMLDGLEAYYAESTDLVAAFCSEYGVDLLVVNEDDFSEEQIAGGEYFFEPINSLLRPEVTSRPHFALYEIAPDKRLFEAENLFVLDCADLEG